MLCVCDLPRGHAAPRRVVLTGGPGAGKTAVLEVVRRYLCPHVAVLPESASIVFGGGFPRRNSRPAVRAAQLAIYHVQDQLERMALSEGDPALLLCDRGVVDGLGYWPDTEAEFWAEADTTREAALARYAAVIHLRPPLAGEGYNHQNALRIETAEEALRIDARIDAAWAGHPRRYVVASEADFLEKLRRTLAILLRELPPCCREHFPANPFDEDESPAPAPVLAREAM